jgi:ABC-type multidrug transport system ATPase subunit
MVLSVKNISISLKHRQILKNINFDIKEGECFALLGPNGAGKSTLVDIITEAIKPDSGEISIFNSKSFKNVKNRIGVLYEYVPLFYYYKIKEIIAYVCSVYNVNKSSVIDIINALGIDKIENKMINVLSKGERKKVGVLMTILHNPAFIIVDEPTSDLDPFIREIVWHYFSQNNRTILFTTHLWEEVEKVANKVAFINDGEIIAIDTIERFLSDIYMKSKRKIVIQKNDLDLSMMKNECFLTYKDYVYVYPQNVDSFMSEYQITNCTIKDIELKDIFLSLTNNIKI